LRDLLFGNFKPHPIQQRRTNHSADSTIADMPPGKAQPIREHHLLIGQNVI